MERESFFDQRPAETSAGFDSIADPEAEDLDWAEDIFSAAWGEAESTSEENSEAEPTTTQAGSFEERMAAVEATRSTFDGLHNTLFALLNSSGLASCCVGIFHFHGANGWLGAGGHHHDDEEETHPHHPPHRQVKPVSRPSVVRLPQQPQSSAGTETVAPKSRLSSSQGSVSLGTLVASFASPDILAAA